jgi:ribulose-phosphate 3-epimerase
MRLMISPSLLSADMARLGEEVRRVEAAGADLIHVDVMDGHFVPNLTLGPVVVQAIKRHAKRPLDVHLMICDPEKYAGAFLEAGADILTFHIEAAKDVGQLARRIRSCGAKASISAKPATPIEQVFPFLDAVDMVLVMTVNPGFGGQAMMLECLPKISRLRREAGNEFDIEVDGGINLDTIKDVALAGANIIVAGNAIFSSKDPAGMIRRMKARLQEFSPLKAPPKERGGRRKGLACGE